MLPTTLSRPVEDTALDAALAELVERARAAWPPLDMNDRELVCHLAARWAGAPPTAAAVAAVHAGDFALACACARRDAAACAAFTAHHHALIRTAVARLGGSPAAADDLTQQVLEHLLAPADDEPRIGRYSGRGPLAGFVPHRVRDRGREAVAA